MSTPEIALPIIEHAPTRPLSVLPEAYVNSLRGVTICSVFPGTLRKQCRHNGTTEYIVKAPARGMFTAYTVYDTQQWIRMASEQGPRFDQYVPAPIPARVVADSLVKDWAGNILRPKNCSTTIGVSIIKGNEPEASELQQLHGDQNAMFNAFIMEANSLHIAGKGVDITDIHRLAAKYMLDEGASQLPWFPTVLFMEVKTCIACRKKIHSEALRCEHCQTFLPQLYLDYNLLATVGDYIDKAVGDFLKTAKPKVPAKPEKPS